MLDSHENMELNGLIYVQNNYANCLTDKINTPIVPQE